MLSVDLQCRRGSFELSARFDLPSDGGVLGIVGPSGCGKTTLLEAIAGIISTARGRIQFNGKAWMDTGRQKPIDLRNRKIGFVFQQDMLFEHLNVRRNLLYGAPDAAALDEIAGALSIAPYLDRMPMELSGGQRRRVALGRALLREPDLVLLDEPLTGLDAATAHSVLLYLKSVLSEIGKPAIYVSHSLSEVNFICRRALGLTKGRIAYDGDPLGAVATSGCIEDRALSALRNIFPVQSVRIEGGDGGLVLDIAKNDPSSTPSVISICALGNRADAELTRGCVIAARDVVLATEKPNGVSARNIYSAKIESIDKAQQLAVVKLNVGIPLAAEVGYASLGEMRLKPGSEVFALFKASAVRLVR